MRLQNFMILFLLSFSLSFPTISARLFPNISSIAPDFLSSNATGTAAAWDSFMKLAGCHPGQTLDGLNKLKQYFHYFGYIGDSGNFTDDFDDALESAIKTYQKNFNLNESGVLDLGTLNQLMKPRCGNADIVNGTTTMNSGKWMTHSNATPHFHTVGHFTFFPGTPRWPDDRRDLTYAFNPGNELTPEAKAVFARAFARWSNVVPMTFTEGDSFITADITIGFFNGDHGDEEPFDGILGTLAHAFSPPSGRFHLDGAENWVIAGDISSSSIVSAVDLESVAVHEIGHLLGLGHSSVEDSIMYPSIPSRTKKVELAEDDIKGIQVLYGINPNYNGSSSSTPSVQERETSSGVFYVHSRWSLISSLMAVGFVILIL